MPEPGPGATLRAQRGVLVAGALLALVAATACLLAFAWPTSLILAAAALLPMLLPLRGLLRGSRRAHAAATLCVLPYFVAGVTEAIANPALRVAGPGLVLASLAWFVTLVRYLRLTRPPAPPPPPAPQAPA